MRQAEVMFNKIIAGILSETDEGHYVFKYKDSYLASYGLPAISPSFPKQREEFLSDELFPLFFNMLSEGSNKTLQCRSLKIDRKDSFGLLLATAKYDTIGAITINEI